MKLRTQNYRQYGSQPVPTQTPVKPNVTGVMEPSRYQSAIYSAFQKPSSRIAINAGPGSGKTTTIVETVKRHVSGLDLMDTIATCFNVDIREAMVQKFPQGTNVANFHRIGKQFVERGLNVRSHKFWVDKNKYNKITWDLALDRGFSPDEDQDVFNMAARATNYAMITLTDPMDSEAFQEMCEDYEITGNLSTLAEIAQKAMLVGQKMAKDGQSIDFNDMVVLPTSLNLPSVKYSNVLIDEAQDLNAAQRALVLSLARSDSRVVAVGDPRQAIYGFAGAAHNSFDMVRDTIGATELDLSICYRCARRIIDEFNEVYPEHAMEAREGAPNGIVESLGYSEIFAKLNPKSGDMVISRITAPIVALAFELIAKKIPAKIKGRDIMANLTSMAATVLKGKGKSWNDFPTLLDAYVFAEETRLTASKSKAADAKLAYLHDKAEAVEILFNASMADGVTSFDAFKRWIYQFFDEDIQGCVVLSTVHKAKGLETDNVFILDPSKMPHPMAKTPDQIAQERNIEWVAKSRAKNAMYYVAPKPR